MCGVAMQITVLTRGTSLDQNQHQQAYQYGTGTPWVGTIGLRLGGTHT